VGNGRNDRLMLKAAALGIAVLQKEGAAASALAAADLVLPNITDALDALEHPLRLIASLRS
jgi:soluble P-type ATPase